MTDRETFNKLRRITEIEARASNKYITPEEANKALRNTGWTWTYGSLGVWRLIKVDNFDD